MQQESPLEIVQAWQEAANRQDVERLLELSDPNIEIVGPRGSGHGHQLLRDWLGRAGLQLETLRVFARGNVVLVAQHGVWRSGESGEVIGEADLASRFLVDGRRIVLFARYDSLEVALAEAGLDARDEIAQAI
jgi:hypothetical protein